MFRKSKCNKCGKKISENFEFCPFCGKPKTGNSQEDWGMLGKRDFEETENTFGLPMGFNKIFNHLMKTLGQIEETKQFEDKKNTNQFRTGGISISISTSGNLPPKIKINPIGNNQIIAEEKIKKNQTPIDVKTKNLKGFSTLPKVEPETKIRRVSDKVIYEINLPGVNLEKDISITKLENGIEIKAVSKEKAYEKNISINLPIIRKNFSKGKLTLELDVKG